MTKPALIMSKLERDKQEVTINKRITEYTLVKELFVRGQDIILSPKTKVLKTFMQHGETSVYAHSLAVAKYSLLFAQFLEKTFKMKLDKDSIVRGALLHDYFLYDWHVMGKGKRTHGLTHPRTAMNNADRDFGLNDLEKDIILKHMFPITPIPPKHRESFIVDIADTWCAICEALKIDISSFVIRRVNFHIALSKGRYTLGENVTNLIPLVKPEFAAEA